LQELHASIPAGIGGITASLLQVLHHFSGRGVLGRGTSTDGKRGGAVELADLVESDTAEAEHRVARRVGPGQRHPRFSSVAPSLSTHTHPGCRMAP